MRRGSPRPLGAAALRLADALAPATPLARVQRVWPEAVGAVIAAEARPVSLRAGSLRVTCRSSVWANELSLLSGDLCGRVNEAAGGELVRELRCTVGSA